LQKQRFKKKNSFKQLLPQGISNNAKGEMEGEQLGWVFLTGQTYEEYQGYGWTNAVHPDDSIEAWNEAVKTAQDIYF
jgi:hypothetical protein